ncbi:glycoside hydrolase, partial [Aureobasidium melanogenum]
MAPWLLSAAVTLLQLLPDTAVAQHVASPFTKASNDSLLWGPYRPNLYFGLRPRLPKSVLTGLLWAKVEDFASVQNNFRYTCEQHEGMAGYGWDAYDPRTGGSQTIHDAGNQIDVTTDFVKFPEHGSNGGSWGARIRGVPREDASDDLKTTMIFNIAVEGLGSLVVDNAEDEENETGFDGDVVITGETPELGIFTVTIVDRKGEKPNHVHPSFQEKPIDKTLVHSVQIPEAALWQAKPVLFSSMKTSLDKYIETYTAEAMPPPMQAFTIPNAPGAGNMHFVQKVFEGAFEFDVIFSSGSGPEPIKSADLSEKIEITIKSFSERFIQSFKPQQPFNDKKYVGLAKSLFSNLIGGIGYFHGDSVVDRSYAPEYEEENEGFWQETAEARARNQQKLEGPYELFTGTPSRPFFPRGFLWDEGFHLLPIIDWDVDLTLQIIKSWFNLMDDDGWIGREQILGPEARSKVPQEFQTQYPHYANPPTLFFVIHSFLDKIAAAKSGQQILGSENANGVLANPDAALQYLRDLYPLLKKHYEWFRKTQAGDLKSYDRPAFSKKEGYRWRGSTKTHLLTSGLDDYPRPQPPHPGELHVDLMSWMGMMTRAMKRIATTLVETDDASTYEKIENAIIRNLDDLHWSADEQAYCDATVDEYEEHALVCHKGYISLSPFFAGLLAPDHPHLGEVLDLISSPEHLWSPHGIRSLSQQDALYGTEENYWRSPVWLPINYLVVKELLNTASATGPHQKRAAKVYTELRKNLVDTVYKSWEKTGFAWEQYNPETGEGQRTQHFTGWTSLVVKIMAMPEVPSVKEGSGHDEL